MTTVSEIIETMAYGPAPESDKPALEWNRPAEWRRSDLFIGGRWTKGKSDAGFDVINPATTAPAGARHAGRPRRTWTAPSRRRGRHFPPGPRCPATPVRATCTRWRVPSKSILACWQCSRASTTASRFARRVIWTSRSWPRHLTHHAGWAQLAESEFAGYGPVGVVGQIVPWELSTPDGGVENRAGPRCGKHRRLKARRVHAAHARCAWPEIAHEAGLPPGVLNVLTGDGRTGELIVNHPDIDKIAFTRLEPRWAASFAKPRRDRARSSRSSWAGKVRSSCSTTPIWDSVVEGVVDAIWFNQGRCVARARACWCTRGSPSGWSRSSGRAWKSCGWARRSIRRSTWVRSSRRCSSSASARW